MSRAASAAACIDADADTWSPKHAFLGIVAVCKHNNRQSDYTHCSLKLGCWPAALDMSVPARIHFLEAFDQMIPECVVETEPHSYCTMLTSDAEERLLESLKDLGTSLIHCHVHQQLIE